MSGSPIRTIAAFLAAGSLALAQVAVDTNFAYRIVNKNSGLALSIEGDSTAAGAPVMQAEDGAASGYWLLMPAGEGQYKILNTLSRELLGITNASIAPATPAVQWADNGTADHLWQITDAGGGYVKLSSVNSGLVLGIGGSSQAPGAVVVQLADDGEATELWQLDAAGGAYPPPVHVLGDIGVHDPSMVKTGDGTYYLFGTHDGILMSSSPDRVHFTSAGQAFASIPGWTVAYSPARDLWAPDISWHVGQYWLYYAASGFGGNVSAIGLATSATAAPGSFIDEGMVIASDTASPYNAIDPGLIVDSSGNWWLVFGSWWDGINLIQLDPSTGKQAAWNRTMYLLAQRPADPAIEGSYIYRHDNYYYLFASFDQCCNGINSTYHIAVGRSGSVTGPYYDRGGIAMTLGGGTIILSSHGQFVGPGGQVMMHDNDGDLLIYHYYDADSNGSPMLGISLVGWDFGGWPYPCESGRSRPTRGSAACAPLREKAPPVDR